MRLICVLSYALYALTSAQAPPYPLPSQSGQVLHPPVTLPSPFAPPVIQPVIPAATTKPAAPMTTNAASVLPVPLPPVTTARPAALPITTAIYNNPFCPPDPGYSSTAGYQGCASSTAPNNVAHDVQGELICDNYSCCLCHSVNCGLNGTPCSSAYFGDSAIVGVQNVRIQGTTTPVYIPGTGMVAGARIDCSGTEACKNAFITADLVHDVECGGEFGCQQSTIIVENPTRGMSVECNNLYSCMNAYIEINIGEAPATPCNPQQMPNTVELGNLQFGGQSAAQGAIIVINNRGCDLVEFEGIECPLESCEGASFRIHGSVQIQQCDIATTAAMIPPQCGGGGGAVFNPPRPSQPATPNLPPAVQVPPVTNPSASTVSPVVPLPSPSTNIQTPGLQQASNKLMQCGEWNTCAHQQYQVINPHSNWELECVAAGSCNQMQVTIDFAPGFLGDRIEGFLFSAADAAHGATIRVNAPYYLDINHLQCKEAGSCTGLLLELGAGVDVYSMSVECNVGACSGCHVKQGTTIVACDTLAAQQGQHYQFLPEPWSPNLQPQVPVVQAHFPAPI